MSLDKTNYITPQGYKKLADELEVLLRIERPELTKLIQWAASNGDRSENADYIYGKRRLREIDKRIRFLSGRLDKAQVVNPAATETTKVQFGARVRVVDGDGKTKTFTIVGVDEVDTSRGHISWQSPIGKTLLGKSAGDEISVRVPNGEVCFVITAVSYHAVDLV